ncbi:hypothetical protein [Parabacteroides goldsteinii]|uniref:hypothetical protein n=1 Tax=Parabacteroides goldsteinii TaxID=328812 RepID=UPI003AB140AF
MIENKKDLKNIFTYILLYIFVAFVCGVIRSEALLSYVSSDILYTATISSYITLIMSTSTVLIYLLGQFVLAYVLLEILGSKPSVFLFSRAIKLFLLFYSINEVVKIFLFFIFIRMNIDYNISSDLSVYELLNETKYFYYSYVSDLIFIVLATLSYMFLLMKKGKGLKKIDIILSSMIFIILFFISHHDFKEIIN